MATNDNRAMVEASSGRCGKEFRTGGGYKSTCGRNANHRGGHSWYHDCWDCDGQAGEHPDTCRIFGGQIINKPVQDKIALAVAAERTRNQWTAMGDGLPTDDGWYSCTVNDNDGFENLVEPYWFDVATGIWSDGDNLSADAIWLNRRSVVAWMPLPSPYTAERATDDSEE